MLHYDFFCHACRSPFSKALTPAAHERPHQDLDRTWRGVTMLTFLGAVQKPHIKEGLPYADGFTK
jgi:hypothetical protein